MICLSNDVKVNVFVFQVVKRKFQKEYDIAVPITFGDDHIVLDIPDNGTCTESGWEIVPLHNARVSLRTYIVLPDI